MKPVLGICNMNNRPHLETCGCIDWCPLPPDPPWWKRTLDSLGNAIGQAKFGGE